MSSPTAQKIANDFWAYINNQDWEKAQGLLSLSFSADWPQSKEKITTPENFISINRNYPGKHTIKVLKTHSSTEARSSDTHLVITEVFIESLTPENKQVKLFAISFFEIKNDKIISLKEFWAETYPAPEWRKHLTSLYT